MIEVTYLGNTYQCDTAIKGPDYVRLLDSRDIIIAAFEGVADFNAFTLTNGKWTEAPSEDECPMVVMHPDGTLHKSNVKLSERLVSDKVSTVIKDLDTQLAEIYNSMRANSVRQICVDDTYGNDTSILGALVGCLTICKLDYGFGYIEGTQLVNGSVSRIIRVCRDYAWQEWEYETPPMEVGVEYRTTDRYMGKPVYTMLFDAGSAPYNNSKSIVLSSILSGASGVIRANGFVSGSTGYISGPLPYEATDVKVDLRVSTDTIFIVHEGDFEAGNIYVHLWYTKGDEPL